MTIKVTVKGVISPLDRGAKQLLAEYKRYKKVLLPRVRAAVLEVVKDRTINVRANQKYMVPLKISRYLKNLPLHPMPFTNQSYWIEKSNDKYFLHIATGEGWTICELKIPEKYKKYIDLAVGKTCSYFKDGKCMFNKCPFNTSKMCKAINPHRGQLELIEDIRNGWIRVHLTIRLPEPEPYEPVGWLGVDVGWNKLATSIIVTEDRVYKPTIYGKEYKTRIIQLRHLLKEYQRAGKVTKKWRNRLQNTVKYAVGVTAKEIVRKAKRHKVGVAMEKLNFKSVTKGYIVPRYKLMIAVKTLCEREGVPFKLVDARYTSITCPKCGYRDKGNRNGVRFKCKMCGYQADADIVAAMNIGKRALIESTSHER